MNDIADQLDHAFLPYIADPRVRALLVSRAAAIAHEHTATALDATTSHDTGITSPTATNPRETT